MSARIVHLTGEHFGLIRHLSSLAAIDYFLSLSQLPLLSFYIWNCHLFYKGIKKKTKNNEIHLYFIEMFDFTLFKNINRNYIP